MLLLLTEEDPINQSKAIIPAKRKVFTQLKEKNPTLIVVNRGRSNELNQINQTSQTQ